MMGNLGQFCLKYWLTKAYVGGRYAETNVAGFASIYIHVGRNSCFSAAVGSAVKTIVERG